MDFTDGFVSKEHQELVRSASESADPLSVSPLQLSASPHSPRSPKSPRSPRSPRSPKSPRSTNSYRSSPKSSRSIDSPTAGSKGNSKVHESTSKNSPLKKYDRHSMSGRDGQPKKGGSGGKGTWGGLLDTEVTYVLDRNDPNYSSNDDKEFFENTVKTSKALEEYKKKATFIVEEYFTNDDVFTTANELRDLGMPQYHYYFVKKLISMAMDRHDKEKEMAASLLSALYADIISPPQVYKGFLKLVECADDLAVDIPDVVDVLAVFIARAVVDDILPPVFLTKQLSAQDSKGREAVKRAEKVYLSAPYHAELIEQKWGGSRNKSVEDVREKISSFLVEYVVSGDKKEACRCIKELNVPFFHHEIVKRAIIMAMERKQDLQAESKILGLLKVAAEEGWINSSQMSKGFSRVIDNVDDLSLDIPNARVILQSLISKAASDGWLCASALKSLAVVEPKRKPLDSSDKDGDAAKHFKTKAQAMIQEYFLSGEISEVCSCLELENPHSCSELNAIFVKRLVNLAMDRKNREKEMASVLLSSLCLSADDMVHGFVMLIESADDTALDNPVVVDDLAKFLARAVVDEVVAPSHLEEIGNQCSGSDSIGDKVLQMAKSLLKARLSGERLLRCWGGDGTGGNGWAVEEVKDKIRKLLEEYECGGDIREARRCIKELGMPFFHHEVVKKAVVMIMEQRNNQRLWALLEECFHSGLITTYQMTKGFERVDESLDDLVLDVPDALQQFSHYVEKARNAGWLDPSYCPSSRSYAG